MHTYSSNPCYFWMSCLLFLFTKYQICKSLFIHFRTDRKYGVNNGGSIGSSSSGLGSSGGLLSGDSEGASDSARIKRENILSELLVTESKYASDLQQVLRNYR